MPKIRLTYGRDIAREGAEVVDVSENRARVLISKRRAVLIEDKADLSEMTKAQLQEHATRMGVEFHSSDTKAEMVDAIRAAEVG